MSLEEFDPELEAARVTLDCRLTLAGEAFASARWTASGASAATRQFSAALYELKMEQRLAEIEREVRERNGEK